MNVPEEKMVSALTDIYTVEGYLDAETGATKDSLAQIYYAQVLSKYNIAKPDFDSTVIYLYHQPARMESIQNKVLEKLQKKVNPDTLNKKG